MLFNVTPAATAATGGGGSKTVEHQHQHKQQHADERTFVELVDLLPAILVHCLHLGVAEDVQKQAACAAWERKTRTVRISQLGPRQPRTKGPR